MDRSLAQGDRPARLVVGDEDAVLRASLRRLLEAPPSTIADVYGVEIGAGFEVVGEAATADDLIRQIRSTPADLVLLDICLVSSADLQTLARGRPGAAAPRIVVLSGAITRGDLMEAIRIGVRGFVLKSATPEVLFEALRWVLEGRCWLDYSLLEGFIETARRLIASSQPGAWLTRREREVLALVVAGYANKEIARAAAVTEDSIKHHLTRMFNKLGVANRVELAMLATERGLLDAPVAPLKIDKSTTEPVS